MKWWDKVDSDLAQQKCITVLKDLGEEAIVSGMGGGEENKMSH